MEAPTTRRRRYLATLAMATIAALALVATGCGDDDDDETTAATVPTTTETGATGATGAGGAGEAVDISETDFALDPDAVEVDAGEVTFLVANDGQTTHNLEIEGNGVEEELPEDLAPGDAAELTVELEPGTYEMYCPVGDHAEQGMEGTVEVK